MKKVFSWVLCIAVLIALVLSPYGMVFAAKSVEEASEANNYDELVKLQYYIQAADACIIGVDRGGYISGGINDTFAVGLDNEAGQERQNLLRELWAYLTLNFSQDVTKQGEYDTTTLYNAYLEYVGQGKIENGSIWCSQLGFDPGAKLMEELNIELWGDKHLDLICGNDDSPGLFKIRYGRGDFSYQPGAWPVNWPEKIENSNDCRKVVLELKKFFEDSGLSIDRHDAFGRFLVKIEINKDGNFSFEKFFKKYVGDLSLVDAQLLVADQYLNLSTVCGGERRTESDWKDKARSADNFYKIYHNGKIEYWHLGSERLSYETYANGSLFVDSTGATCTKIAENLQAEANIVSARTNKEWQVASIVNCYDDAKTKIDDLNFVVGKLESIKKLSDTIISEANAFIKNNYKPVYTVSYDYVNDEEIVELRTFPTIIDSFLSGNVSQIREKVGDALAVDGFYEISMAFLKEAREYRDRASGENAELSEEEKSGFDALLERYSGNVERFNGMLENVKEKMDEDINKNEGAIISSQANYVTSLRNCLNSDGSSCLDSIRVDQNIQRFYSLKNDITSDDDIFSCEISDSIKPKAEEFGNIIGANINYEDYDQIDKPSDEGEWNEDGTLIPYSTSESVCYDGAGTLGWIACPIITALDGAGDFMWNDIIENHLKIPANEVFKSESGVRKGWDAVRIIANMVFIILFLVVIFSQLTGVGIDNYGIKKILPKLIIIAILVNLSYVICQVAVDLSNIFGKSINDLLSGWAGTLGTAGEGMSGGDQVGSWTLTVILGGGGIILFETLKNGGFGSAMGAIGLAVLGIMVVILLALLTLYLILVAREAGIVLAIILSPVAIVCYALPNTEKMAKKWFDLFKALLVVYPICGAMVGGGQLAGAVLSSINSESMKLAAMVVQVLPFFLVPSLLKSSLSLMGNVGAKISSIGKTVGKRGSNIAQSFAKLGYESKPITRLRAGVDKNGNLHEVGRFRRFVSGGKRGIAKARSQYAKNVDAEMREKSWLGAGGEAALVGLKKKAEKDEVSDYVTLVNDQTRNGADEDALMSQFEKYNQEGNKAGMVAVARVAGRRKDSASRFIDKALAGYDVKGKDGKTKKVPFNSTLMRSVAKEIAEGETSANYLAGSPLAFEYASAMNRNKGIDSVMDPYSDWLQDKRNVHDAINHFVTKPNEMLAIQGSNLREMADMISNQDMDERDAAQLGKIADEIIRTNRENGTQIDYTKVEEIYRLAYGDNDYQNKMKEDGLEKFITRAKVASSQVPNPKATAAQATATQQVNQNGVAQEGVSFNVQKVQNQNQAQSSIIRPPVIRKATPEEANQILSNPNPTGEQVRAAEQRFRGENQR